MEAQPAAHILNYATPKSHLNIWRFVQSALFYLAVVFSASLLGAFAGRSLSGTYFQASLVFDVQPNTAGGGYRTVSPNFLPTIVAQLESNPFQNGVFQHLSSQGIISSTEQQKYKIEVTLERRTDLIHIDVAGENATVASAIAQSMEQTYCESLVAAPSPSASVDTLSSTSVLLSPWRTPPVLNGALVGLPVGIMLAAIAFNRRRRNSVSD